MGITIEQYRARIGTYIVRTRVMSAFKGIFCNRRATLTVIAGSSLYLLGCFVYAAWLLRMANDVEEILDLLYMI